MNMPIMSAAVAVTMTRNEACLFGDANHADACAADFADGVRGGD